MIDSGEVFNKLYDLIDEIKLSNEYIELKNSYDSLLNDETSKILISNFNEAKEMYNANPSKENTSKLSLAKKNLYTSKLFITYQEKLDCFNLLLSDIEKDINDKVFKENLRKLLSLR